MFEYVVFLSEYGHDKTTLEIPDDL